MGTILLHHPWVQFYLLYVGALWGVFIWDYLRNLPAARDGARTAPSEAPRCGTTPPPQPRSPESCTV